MKNSQFALMVLSLLLSPNAFAIFGSNTVVKSTPDRTDCIPAEVQALLKDVAQKFGKVQVVSGYRAPGYGPNGNARRGGAKKSLHLQCRAADFLVPRQASRTTQKALQQFLLEAKAKYHTRYNVYCSGRSHVDNNTSGLPDSYASCVERPTYRNSGAQKSFQRSRRPFKL